MEKTAMQEMHDELMANKHTLPIWLILRCEELLEKERDQMIKSYQQGVAGEYCDALNFINTEEL
jgi:hypothetical protein